MKQAKVRLATPPINAKYRYFTLNGVPIGDKYRYGALNGTPVSDKYRYLWLEGSSDPGKKQEEEQPVCLSAYNSNELSP